MPKLHAILATCVALLLMVTAGLAASNLAASSPGQICAALGTAIRSGRIDPVAPWLTPKARDDIAALALREQADHRLAQLSLCALGRVAARVERPEGTSLTVDARCAAGVARWSIAFSDTAGLLDTVGLETFPTAPPPVADAPAAPPQPAAPATTGPRRADGSGRAFHSARSVASRSAVPPAADHALPEIVEQSTARRLPPPPAPPPPASAGQPGPPPQPSAPPAGSGAALPSSLPPPPPPVETAAPADPRTVEFLLATTRKVEAGPMLRFTADRSDSLTYGIVRVHVPLDHKAGHVERPMTLSFLGFTLYEQKLDEKKHFVVSAARLIGADDFNRYATSDPHKEALIFVHGFNNTFEESSYRFAQILYDLQYARPAILFSWASKGSVFDYLYDKDSAEQARDRFAALVRSLRTQGVERINVIAHSMGNFLAVPALADSADSVVPNRVEQLIMAAPDISRDYFSLEAPKLVKVAHALTLYACATDRALEASKDAAGGIPRAGDVPPDGPLVLPGIDTIDVSVLGSDWFGLNHDVFASNRSVMDDIIALLTNEKPPPRLAQIKGMPEGIVPPRYWRFLP